MKKTKICIVGAGPGGAATALKLSYMGIPCTLIDKASFPRDKVCGDAISGKVTTLLNRLDPQILARFKARADWQVGVWGIKFVAPNNVAMDIPFKMDYDKETEPAPGYVSRRMDFDNFLIAEVRRRDNIDFHENVAIDNYEKLEKGYEISSKDESFKLQTTLLIIANGAHSSFSRHKAGLKKDPQHHAGAVRAYFKNVKNMHPDNFIELHFIKAVIPGYFWIFPLPNGYTNVGVGMRSDFISKNKVNLKKTLFDLVEKHPDFKGRFEEAELEGKVEGFGLPFGSKKRVLSGDHYMLVGDAAHLIDPFSGEGIGNAIYSGFIAAEQAVQCFEQENFSAKFLKAFDVRVARVLGTEMKLSYQLQRLLRYPRLANFLANFVARNRNLLDLISKMYTDFALRKQLINPIFWVKVLSGKLK